MPVFTRAWYLHGGRSGQLLRSETTLALSRQKENGCSLACFILWVPSICALSWRGDNEIVRERKKNREIERKEGNGVKHKEESFEQAPGLSWGRGRAVPTTLPSVKQTDGERKKER